MAVSSDYEAVSDFVSSATNLSGVPVVALPPSDADPAVGQMRVYVGGVLTIRHYDPNPEP